MSAKKWMCWRTDAVGVLFCVGMSLVAYFVGLRPFVQQHTALAEQQAELKVQRQEASQLAASDSAHKIHLASVRRDLAESRIKLQSTDYVNRQIAALTKLINECGLKVNDIQLGKIFEGSRYDIVPINLSGSGRYKKCVVFLHRLSESFPDTGVASFSITGSPGQPDEIGGFSFELFWYAAPRARFPRK